MLINNIRDKEDRRFEYLRISITDKCNFRCSYCMPQEKFGKNHKFLKRDNLLSYEELIRLIKIFENIGLTKIRITGGEPMLRKRVDNLIRAIKTETNIKSITMTSNGSLLNKAKLQELKDSGLDNITLSLDSVKNKTNNLINPTKFDFTKILRVIDETIEVFGFAKINMVVIKQINHMEISNMIDVFKNKKAQLRFIEYMDVGESNKWNIESVFTTNEIKKIIAKEYRIQPLPNANNSTSERWSISNHLCELAFISSISKPFCSDCDRGRLSADGKFFTCLFSNKGYDLLHLVRDSNNDDMILKTIMNIWSNRQDKYSEIRFSEKIKKENKNKVEMSYIGG